METKELAPTTATQEVAPVETNYQLVDVNNFESIPDLATAEVIPVDLNVNYWTPEDKGEKRRCIFNGCTVIDMMDPETSELKKLNCANFIMRDESGNVVKFSNGSSRLVGVFENGTIPVGLAVEIEYKGKEKNSTNAFKSDRWSVMPLKIKAAAKK